MRDVDFGPGPIRGVLPTRWIGGDNRWRWRRRSAWNRSVVFVFLAAREREGDDRVSDLAAVGVHGSGVVRATVRVRTEGVAMVHVAPEGIGDVIAPPRPVDGRRRH